MILVLAATLGWIGLVGPLDSACAADLRPTTAVALERYIHVVEARINERVTGQRSFLWVDDAPGRRTRVQDGEVVAERSAGARPVDVPDGLVHDFVGAVFIPGVTLDKALAFVQDYDHHRNFYGPELVDSRVISRDGERFVLYLRLKKQ